MKYLLFLVLFIWSIAAKAQTSKELIGCWTMPAMKDENLSLDSDGNFFFNDYQEYTRSIEPVFGTWKLKGGNLILTYGEQKQIRFKVKWTEAGVWMLYRPGKLQLFKAATEDCEKQ
jgi:hypothetical protein